MGDRTYHQGRIVAQSIETAVLIGDHLSQEWLPSELSVQGRIVQYACEDAYLGSTDQIIEQAYTIARDRGEVIAYHAWEDPRYEFPGALTMSDGSDSWYGDCTSNGDAYLIYQGYVTAKADGATDAVIFGENVRTSFESILTAAEMEVTV
jgi:hypothetical protein